MCHMSVCQDKTGALTSSCDNLSSWYPKFKLRNRGSGSEGQGQWLGDSMCGSEACVSWQQVHRKSVNVGEF